MKVGRRFFFLLSSILLLQLVQARKCTSGGGCVAVSMFNYKTYDVQDKSTKECGDDACAIFWCLVDGKKVKVGYGCYSDYESICGDVSNNAQIDVKNMMQWDDKEGVNAKVYACKPLIDDYKCADKKRSFYVDLGFTYFPQKFIQGADMSYKETCEYVDSPPQPSNPENVPHGQRGGAMNQMNGFKLFGLIFIGFMLAQFW